MHHIVYQSSAVGEPTAADLAFLLEQARTNNLRLGITGLLLYGSHSFLQVLEGEEEAVRAVYARIKVDYRNTRVFKLADGPIQKRLFANWSMGFQTLTGEEFARLTGYIDPYRSGFLDAYLPSVDEELVSVFKSFVVDESAQF
ncbi:BLUF domain-containing protein [Hymenobacter koreensis]|uniref:BLUF domain-containing protein n=1 Tax=Hymenobacter koreensis TaxID=1084523 RepID=A0ABP8IYI3_9BACT